MKKFIDAVSAEGGIEIVVLSGHADSVCVCARARVCVCACACACVRFHACTMYIFTVVVLAGDLDKMGDFGKYGGLVFELFYRADLSAFG